MREENFCEKNRNSPFPIPDHSFIHRSHFLPGKCSRPFPAPFPPLFPWRSSHSAGIPHSRRNARSFGAWPSKSFPGPDLCDAHRAGRRRHRAPELDSRMSFLLSAVHNSPETDIYPGGVRIGKRLDHHRAFRGGCDQGSASDSPLAEYHPVRGRRWLGNHHARLSRRPCRCGIFLCRRPH